MGTPIAAVVERSKESGQFQLPSGDWKSRNWRGEREERWVPERIILFALAQPESRRPRFGYAADNGRR